MNHNLPTRDEMVQALGTWITAEEQWRKALHAGRYDELARLSNEATTDYKALRALIDRLPTSPDDAVAEFDRNRRVRDAGSGAAAGEFPHHLLDGDTDGDAS